MICRKCLLLRGSSSTITAAKHIKSPLPLLPVIGISFTTITASTVGGNRPFSSTQVSRSQPPIPSKTTPPASAPPTGVPSSSRLSSSTLNAPPPQLKIPVGTPIRQSGLVEAKNQSLEALQKLQEIASPVLPQKKVYAVPTESIAPAGSVLKGLNYIKGRDDPIAKEESEYPEWLWGCLDTGNKASGAGEVLGDAYSKSAKQRRLAAKAERKALAAKEGTVAVVPIHHQSIDLPAADASTDVGAEAASVARREVTGAMRKERRKKIKEDNYLRGMR